MDCEHVANAWIVPASVDTKNFYHCNRNRPVEMRSWIIEMMSWTLRWWVSMAVSWSKLLQTSVPYDNGDDEFDGKNWREDEQTNNTCLVAIPNPSALLKYPWQRCMYWDERIWGGWGGWGRGEENSFSQAGWWDDVGGVLWVGLKRNFEGSATGVVIQELVQKYEIGLHHGIATVHRGLVFVLESYRQ